MRRASKLLRDDMERDLRVAVMTLRENPQDQPALATVLDFTSAVLNIGGRKTATARRVERERALTCAR